MPDAEEVVPEVVPAGLARRDPDVERVTEHVERAAQKVADRMEARWAEEKAEREKWAEEDKLEEQFVRVASLIASGLIGEGAVSVRMTAKQVAEKAVEHAEALLDELHVAIPKRKARYAARKAAESKKG